MRRFWSSLCRRRNETSRKVQCLLTSHYHRAKSHGTRSAAKTRISSVSCLLDSVARPGPEYDWSTIFKVSLNAGPQLLAAFSLCPSLSLLAFSGCLIIPGGMHCPHPSVPPLPSGRGSSDCPLHPSPRQEGWGWVRRAGMWVLFGKQKVFLSTPSFSLLPFFSPFSCCAPTPPPPASGKTGRCTEQKAE